MSDLRSHAMTNFYEMRAASPRADSRGFLVFVKNGKFKFVNESTEQADRQIAAPSSFVAGTYHVEMPNFSFEQYLMDCDMAYCEWQDFEQNRGRK